MAKSLNESFENLSLENKSAGQSGIVGISFGNQYSTICMYNDNKISTIANEDGDRMIPVCITFYGDGECMVGTQAKIQSVNKFKSTLSNFRHLIGSNVGEAEVMGSLTMAGLYPLKPVAVHQQDSTIPSYSLQLRSYNEETEEELVKEICMSAQELTRIYFEKLRQTIEGFFGAVHGYAENAEDSDRVPISNLKGCVVSVPQDFSSKQRSALMESVSSSGFGRVHFIHEHAAAVLAYLTRDSLENPTAEGSVQPQTMYLVVDLGSHSLKVSVVHVCVPQAHHHSFKAMETHGLMTVLSSVVRNDIGGFYFDKKLVGDYLAKEFARKTKMDVTESKKSMIKLMLAAEGTKKALSSRDAAPCYVESLMDGVDFNVSVNRGRFEMIIEPLISLVPSIILDSLRKADVPLSSIDQVLFVGGASRIPSFQRVVRSLFADCFKLPLYRTEIEGDECIGQGCAIHGKILSSGLPTEGSNAHSKQPHLSKSIVLDMGAGRKQLPWIPANAVLPVRRTINVVMPETSKTATIRVGEKDQGSFHPLFEFVLEENPKQRLALTLTVETDGNMKLHSVGTDKVEKTFQIALSN